MAAQVLAPLSPNDDGMVSNGHTDGDVSDWGSVQENMDGSVSRDLLDAAAQRASDNKGGGKRTRDMQLRTLGIELSATAMKARSTARAAQEAAAVYRTEDGNANDLMAAYEAAEAKLSEAKTWLDAQPLGRAAQPREKLLELERFTRDAQLSAGRIPSLLTGDRQVLDEVLESEDLTPTMASAIRVGRLLLGSEGFEASKVLPIFRRILREPEAQQLSVQMASSLSERAVSRAVRLLFNVPQPRFNRRASAGATAPQTAGWGGPEPGPSAQR